MILNNKVCGGSVYSERREEVPISNVVPVQNGVRKFCFNCGSAINPDGKHCADCGAML